MTDISDIFEMNNAKKEQNKTEKRSRKKKEYTEEEKQKIKERLKLGKVKAAEARDAKQEKSPPTPSPQTMQEVPKQSIKKKPDTMQEEITNSIREKIITKHILELDETDGIDAKELKQFLSKLYKASKQKHVQDAMNNYDKPQPEPTPKPKTEIPKPSIQEKHHEPSQIVPPKPPKPSKEELEEAAYKERMAKLKKQLANKKRR